MFVPILLVLLAGLSTATSKEICETPSQEVCESLTSQYEKYRECMERRTKRSIECDYEEEEEEETTCENCNCDSCNSCETKCSSCCENSCKSYHCCHKTCRAQCKSTSCRTSCKKKCQDRPNEGEKIITVITNSTNSGSSEHSKHNITTIIHLNNIINNTNVIDIPVILNNTNLNNITIVGGFGGQSGPVGPPGVPGRPGTPGKTVESPEENCCVTVGPRICTPQKEYPFVRCYHIRRRACGHICSAPVVHYQKHEICDKDIQQPQVELQPTQAQPPPQQPCRNQVVYVPQPRPRCAYQPNWPYVSCGNSGYQTCDGCYNHYINKANFQRCSSFCYDDGFGQGPYYRQGPFYRQGYAPVPSCLQTGTCWYPGIGSGTGGYDLAGLGGPFQAGFPFNGVGYPPNTYDYPFVIEDPANGTQPWGTVSEWNAEEPILNPYFAASSLGVKQPVSIESSVGSEHNDAEIVIVDEKTITPE